MKKVIIVGPFPLPINGCSFANEVLLKNLQNRKITCTRIDTSTNEISSKQGSQFSIYKTIAFIKVYLGLYKIINKDIVYITPGHTFYGVLKYAPFIILALLFKIPYFVHIHGNYLGKEYELVSNWKKKILKFLLSNAEGGIVLSKLLYGNLIKFLPQNKIHIVENFVEESLFQNDIVKQKDKIRILYLSNLMEEKGVLQLIDACEILTNRNFDFELKMAGNIEESIVDLVHSKINNIPSIEYLGTVHGEEKKKLFHNANVFILPTYYTMEGQPISILEGMATGNIVVVTRHSGIPDVVSEKNGFFIEKKSVNSIVDVLIQISDDLKIIDIFKEENINYCKQNFTEEMFTEKILSVFEKKL
jgi:glycosyltransferase involved in cell wall biosynthesis